MLNTPVLFLVFNRPDLTVKVFATIRDAKPAQLFIGADGPRTNKPGEAEKCEQVRNLILEGVDWDCEVHTLFREENLGCKIAVSNAITWFFENVDAGIILEDDILPDQSFFKYCEELLIKYKDDKNVTQICGVNYSSNHFTVEESYFFSKIGGIWGWATWRRCWKYYDVDIKSWGVASIRKDIKKFLNNPDWFARVKGNFDTVYNNKYDTWDYQWVFTQLMLSGMSIVPKSNLIMNLGFRDDATHTVGNNDFVTSLTKNRMEFPLKSSGKVVSNEEYEKYSFNLLPLPNKKNWIRKYLLLGH